MKQVNTSEDSEDIEEFISEPIEPIRAFNIDWKILVTLSGHKDDRYVGLYLLPYQESQIE